MKERKKREREKRERSKKLLPVQVSHQSCQLVWRDLVALTTLVQLVDTRCKVTGPPVVLE
jgi:hypothetical protein